MKFAGIRYLSRLSTEWECWALFENVALAEQERRPIRRTTPHRRSLRFDRFLTSASQRMAQELLVVTIGICFLNDKSFRNMARSKVLVRCTDRTAYWKSLKLVVIQVDLIKF